MQIRIVAEYTNSDNTQCIAKYKAQMKAFMNPLTHTA